MLGPLSLGQGSATHPTAKAIKGWGGGSPPSLHDPLLVLLYSLASQRDREWCAAGFVRTRDNLQPGIPSLGVTQEEPYRTLPVLKFSLLLL